jgi:hypothetical protein
VQPVTRELGCLAHAFQADPAVADRVLWVASGKLLARAWVNPRRVDEL